MSIMNFIPSKVGHEEVETQSKSGIQSYSNLNQALPQMYLNNIRGDEDSNEGHVSDEDEYYEQESYMNQYEQSYIMGQQNIQSNINYNNYYQDQKNNKAGSEGYVNQIISPRQQQQSKLHGQSLSMKENLPTKYYNNGKISSSPNKYKSGKVTKENQQQQSLQQHPQQLQQYSSNSNTKSFEKSYQELTQQILAQRLENVQLNDYSLKPQDLLLGQQQLQDLQKRKQYDSKTQEELFKRLNKEAELQNDYKHQLTLEQQRKEMEQCTFTPQTYCPKVEEQRTLNQFLEDQEKFQKNQADKINMLRFQIQEEQNQKATHKPNINSKSDMIVQMKRTDKEPVHDRLYKIHQEKSNRISEVRTSNQSNTQLNGTNRFSTRTSNQQYQTQRISEYELELEQQNTFQPQINEKSKMMMRKGKVGDHLYQDALRRQEKSNIQQQQESVMTKQQKSTMSSQTNRIVSSKTEQIVAMKFVREFETVCDEILHDPNSQKIDYLQMGEILNRLHFLKNQGEESNLNNIGQERKLVYDIWQNLRGDELGGVTKCNLCQFLLIIIGIFGFQLQTEDQIRQMQQIQNENNVNNLNIAHPLQGDSHNTKMPQTATLYLQERYTEEEDEEYDQYNNYHNLGEQKYMQLKAQQQLNDFNQGNNHFIEKLQQYSQNQRNRKGFIDQIGNWNIPADEAKILQKEFDILYRNRLCNEELKKTDFKQENTFQPQINPQSKRLAENYREKLLEETATLIQNQEIQVKVPANGKVTHVDLLVFQKQAQLKERQKKNQAQSQAQQQSCTFHPQVLSSSSSLISRNNLNNQSGQMSNNLSNPSLAGNNQNGLRKSNQLYQLSKLKNQKKDKDKNEIEYEKNFDECTFQPDTAITRSKSSNALRKSNASIVSVNQFKDTDKYIERMRIANKQREEKNAMLSRGYNNKGPEFDKKKFEKTAPVSSRLYNDVPLYRQSKQNNDLSNTQEEQSNIQQNQQFVDNNQSQEYSQYQQYMMNQKQTEQSYDNHQNTYSDGYGLYSYNQENDEALRQTEQSLEKLTESNNSQFQYNQIQPINPLEKVPLLFVDVNLGREKTERIIVFEGDTSDALAAKFAEEYKLDPSMKQKLKELLDNQIAGLLTKIDEEEAPSMMSD